MKRTPSRGLYSPELLESRIAPAAIIVTSLADDGSDTVAEITLREAIDAANLAPGTDTITFDPALIPVNPPSPPVVTTLHAKITLTSQIEIKDTLIIKGPGVDKLAISGNDNSRIFDIFDSDDAVLHPTTISGLSFEHGNVGVGENGGAIQSTESLILKNTTFSNNYAQRAGGAIFVDTKGIVSITGSAFLNNTAFAEDSGAMYARAQGSISVIKSLVSGNSSSNGDVGGISLYLAPGGSKPAHILVDSVTFLGNSAGAGDGGGLWALNNTATGKITVKNSSFAGNTATGDGGGLWLGAGIASVTGSTFSNNTAGTVNGGGGIVDVGGGGALFHDGVTSASLTVKSSKFEGNSATGRGGAVNVDDALIASIAGSIFIGNESRAEGGAISADDTLNFTIAGSLIAGNSSVGGFGGGGIFIENTTLVLKGSVLSGNSATNVGGGLRATLGSVLTVSGGSFSGNHGNDGGGGIFTQGIGTDAVDLTVTGTKFSGNSGNNGGAIFTTGDGEVFIKGVKVLGNIANNNGGGMYLSSSTKITVSGSLFASNRAGFGGGLFLEGAGTILVTGASFLTNSAGESGGGIYLSNTGPAASILKSKITGNIAAVAGGGILGPSGLLTPVLTGSVIKDNFASTGANIYLA